MYAAEALGRIGDESAVHVLNQALRDADARVRREAATALGKLAHPQATDPLIEVGVGESEEEAPDSRVSDAAWDALVETTGVKPPYGLVHDPGEWKRWWDENMPDDEHLAERACASGNMWGCNALGWTGTTGAMSTRRSSFTERAAREGSPWPARTSKGIVRGRRRGRRRNSREAEPGLRDGRPSIASCRESALWSEVHGEEDLHESGH